MIECQSAKRLSVQTVAFKIVHCKTARKSAKKAFKIVRETTFFWGATVVSPCCKLVNKWYGYLLNLEPVVADSWLVFTTV